jgi:imidazolonepropionase-like amidohydrolase
MLLQDRRTMRLKLSRTRAVISVRRMRIKLLLLLLVMIFRSHAAGAQPRHQSASFYLTHATVIDMTGAPAKPDMTVLIKDNRIAELGRTGEVQIPQGAQVIDATGKFLIPGLWDMHVHILFLLRRMPDTFSPLFIANGVTSVRDMHGDLELFKKWRAGTSQGTQVRPRVVSASLIVDGPKPLWSESLAVTSAEDGRKAVRELKTRGANFVKVYSLLPRAAFFAIADESKKQGLPLAGHVPISVTAAEASDAGLKSLEHLLGVLLGCSSEEDRLRWQLMKEVVSSGYAQSVVMRRLFFAPPEQIIKTYDERKAASLFARFAGNGTRQVPTLVVWRGEAFASDDTFRKDPRLRFVPRPIRESWLPQNSEQLKDLTPADVANLKKLYERYLELVGAMHRAGVEFMVGTDAPNPYVFPGFSVHDEMSLLVQAGLTPMQALQAATRNPAKYSGLDASLGTVERGKIADLVLLDANPLEDIGNSQKIAAVIFNGHLIRRQELNKLLTDVENSAR